MSGYFVVYAILAIWVFIDARKRKNNVIGWPGATVFAGPLVLPVYLAKRHLKEGEVREGGTGWNVLKNFALFWTLTIVFFGIMIVVAASSQADGASAALGATLGIGMLGFVWFSVLVAALVLGLFLKKASVVEKGPTGPLAANQGGTVMQGVLLLCLLWSYPALAVAAPAASMDEVRQSIIQRCRNQMSDYGASIVKVCVDEDLRAYQMLLSYDDEHKAIIDRCKRQMLAIGGWTIVQVCADGDIEAERALENY